MDEDGSWSGCLPGVDAKLQFSLEPPGTESGYAQWLEAMRAVARLPDGIPHHFRNKVTTRSSPQQQGGREGGGGLQLWLTLAEHHIDSLGLDWEGVARDAFNDRLNPDDDKLGEQIIKDLHRTGWSGLSGVGERAQQERILLKRVLLAYARFNKAVGYCQGFNVIAALVLDVADFKEDHALKVAPPPLLPSPSSEVEMEGVADHDLPGGAGPARGLL